MGQNPDIVSLWKSSLTVANCQTNYFKQMITQHAFFSDNLMRNVTSLQWCLASVKKDSSLMPALFIFLPDIISIITIRIYCSFTVKDIKLAAIELQQYTAVVRPVPQILQSRRLLNSIKVELLTLSETCKAPNQVICQPAYKNFSEEITILQEAKGRRSLLDSSLNDK